MKDKGLQLFYLLKSVSGADEGVYQLSDLPHLPKEAQKQIVPLAVAAALGYVDYDREAVGNINSLPIYAKSNPKTSSVKEIHGVKEGFVQSGRYSADTVEKIVGTTEKIGNSLRSKLQDMKQQSAENSLKSQIEEKKKQLQTNKE